MCKVGKLPFMAIKLAQQGFSQEKQPAVKGIIKDEKGPRCPL